MDQAAGNGSVHHNGVRDILVLRNLRIAAAIIVFQLLSGTAVTLWPGSMQGYAPVFTLPVAFSLLPGSALVALLLNIILDQYGHYLQRIHYVGPTPGFPTAVWVPVVLAIGGVVLLAAFSVIKGRPSRLAYWTLVIAEVSCVLSPLALLFLGLGGALALGLVPALIPLIALAFLIAAHWLWVWHLRSYR